MSGIKDHDYLKICAELASCLSISIAAAKKKIDLAAASKNIRDISSRTEIAIKLLDEARKHSLKGDFNSGNQLDDLLKALAKDENFMVED